jgi:hypothetical protein
MVNSVGPIKVALGVRVSSRHVGLMCEIRKSPVHPTKSLGLRHLRYDGRSIVLRIVSLGLLLRLVLLLVSGIESRRGGGVRLRSAAIPHEQLVILALGIAIPPPRRALIPVACALVGVGVVVCVGILILGGASAARVRYARVVITVPVPVITHRVGLQRSLRRLGGWCCVD